MKNLTELNGTQLIHSITVGAEYKVVQLKEGNYNGMKVQAVHVSEPRVKVMKDDEPTEETYFVLIDRERESMCVTESQFNNLLTQL